MSKDPWSVLSKPAKDGDVVVRRVDENSAWNFFWGLDQKSCCLLLLQLSAKPPSLTRLPHLKGIDVLLADPPIGPSLVIRLLNDDLRDIFGQLCVDILATAGTASSELEVLEVTLNRTWRWHYLLRGGGGALLSPEEQLGLLGELYVLESHLLPVLSTEAALESWKGPYGSAQDFMAGSIAIEAKVYGPTPAGVILISSEDQLDGTGFVHLFIHATMFMPSAEDVASSFTLSDVVDRIRQAVAQHGFQYQQQLDALLSAAGFRQEDDYSPWRWRHRESTVYEVHGSFPRLIPATLPAGVADVRYSLALNHCTEYLVTFEHLQNVLKRTSL